MSGVKQSGDFFEGYITTRPVIALAALAAGSSRASSGDFSQLKSSNKLDSIGLSGMFYNYQRDYDPAVGRYSQSDPIELAGGVSVYS